MPIAAAGVVIATTATLIAQVDRRANTDLLPITLRNDSGVDIWLGGSDVTTDATKGLRIANNELIPFELGQSDALYGRVVSGTATIQVLTQRT